MENVRINKFLSEAGVTSRRGADRLIEAGKVQINGRIAGLGDRVEADDEVRVDGRIVGAHPVKPLYIAFHKPVGVISTAAKEAKDTIFDYIPLEDRLFYVGRLDVASSGLMLLTNDGDLAYRLTRASEHHEKEYIVSVNKDLQKKDLAALENGVSVLGRQTAPAHVKQTSRREFHINLTEGGNRQIRRMVEAVGYEVKALHRIRIANIRLGHLKEGDWRHLRDTEKKELLKIVT